MTTCLIYYSFLKKLLLQRSSIHMLTKLAFYEQRTFALFGIINSGFFALSEKKTFQIIRTRATLEQMMMPIKNEQLPTIKEKHGHKRLVYMFKIMHLKAPNYLINLIPKDEPTIRTRNNSIQSHKYRTNYFKPSFLPSTLNDWFYLHINIRNSDSILLFKYRLLSFIRAVQNSIYNIFDPKNQNF